jgi:signal peptidase I
VAEPDTRSGPTVALEPGRSDEPTGPEPERRSRLAFLRELPVLIILAFALAIVLKTFVVQAFYIPSASMEPTLLPGDRVLVNKVLYHPHRGDIIVFEDPHPGPQPDRGVIGGVLHWLSQGLGFSQPPNEDFIKRIVGLPGETLEIHDHQVSIDGTALPEPYLTATARRSMSDFGPVQIPRDAVFVMGDNRGDSDDSRGGLGFIPLSKIVGRAFVRIWPPTRVGWLH